MHFETPNRNHFRQTINKCSKKFRQQIGRCSKIKRKTCPTKISSGLYLHLQIKVNPDLHLKILCKVSNRTLLSEELFSRTPKRVLLLMERSKAEILQILVPSLRIPRGLPGEKLFLTRKAPNRGSKSKASKPLTLVQAIRPT